MGLASWTAVRSDSPSSTNPNRQDRQGDGLRLQRMRMTQLLVALIQREQRPQGEQHHRDQERGEVADPAVPKGWPGSGPRRARRPPASSIAWLPESATECRASASIEDAPVTK